MPTRHVHVSLAVAFAVLVAALPLARAQNAPGLPPLAAIASERPLPPPPGSIPVRMRTQHFLLKASAVPRLPAPAPVDSALLNGGAATILRQFPPEQWSCTRRGGRAIDPAVAAQLPASLHGACFYEGFETLAVVWNSETGGLMQVHRGGYVAASVLRRRMVSTRFHGVMLRDTRLPAMVARDNDSVLLEQTGFVTSRPVAPPPEEFLRTVQPSERWIYVDRDNQLLVAYVGRAPVMLTFVSTGRGYFPTYLGEYRVIRKLTLGNMRDYDPGRGDRPYHITGIPDIQYFNRGQAFHGVFWHNRFGTRTSHGCVNMSLADAQWLYDFTEPLPNRWPRRGTTSGAVTTPAPVWFQGREGAGNRVFVYSAERGLAGGQGRARGRR
ncbi:MAG: L,D-transpeptidase [Deltaproteobacteria bacterium]|nr:L,D-transpeptidase [Deltaproteobacteria bacterium]